MRVTAVIPMADVEAHQSDDRHVADMCWCMQGGLRLTPGAFFSNWFATMLVTLVAQSFGLLIGATVMNAKTAQTVTAVVMLTMMLGEHR